MDLTLFGWNPFFEAAFASWKEQGFIRARVAMEDKHAYVVLTEQGDMSASVSGKLLHDRSCNADLPKVGDWVAVAVVAGEGKAIIQGVLPRRTRLARRLPGREVQEQVLAANIETAFVVQALDSSFNRRQLERFLVMVHEGGAKPVVVLNKTDLCDSLEARVGEARLAARSAPVVAACAKTGRGMKQLRELIPATETIVFIGPSGVGKSSLINRLYGETIQPTLEVRETDAKGRHSTTWRELIQLPWGGLVIDTPGMREFQSWNAVDGLREAFPDIEEIGVGCHFRDCTHTVEKRCAVQTAVADGKLSQERYNNFLKLQRESDYLAVERKKHTYLTRQRNAKVARSGVTKSKPGGWDDSPDEGW